MFEKNFLRIRRNSVFQLCHKSLMVRFKNFFYFLDNKIVFTANVAVKEGERE